jgi:hypothetical protein
MVSRLTDLNRPRCQVALSLIHNALGIGHGGVVDENVEVILRSKPRADVAIERKIGPICTFDRLGHVWVGGMHQISHLAAHLLLPERRASECIRRCGSRSGMHSWNDDTTNQGTFAWNAITPTSAILASAGDRGPVRIIKITLIGHLLHNRIPLKRCLLPSFPTVPFRAAASRLILPLENADCSRVHAWLWRCCRYR